MCQFRLIPRPLKRIDMVDAQVPQQYRSTVLQYAMQFTDCPRQPLIRRNLTAPDCAEQLITRHQISGMLRKIACRGPMRSRKPGDSSVSSI